jgi:predicted nucleic acid-binding protein
LSAQYLLDTSVISSIGPGRAGIETPLLNWFIVTLPRVYLSSVSVFEIEQGIQKLERSGAKTRAETTRRWLEQLLEQFGDERLLMVDVTVAREAGRLSDWASARGIHPGLADIMIAATAIAHDLVLLTYNMKHFGPLEIGAVDPSEQLPR